MLTKFPGCVYLISMYYRRHELQKRVNFFFSASIIAGAFSGVSLPLTHNPPCIYYILTVDSYLHTELLVWMEQQVTVDGAGSSSLKDSLPSSLPLSQSSSLSIGRRRPNS